MSLIHNNVPFLVLNFNLKSGLLTGALALSLATGAITLVNHQSEIKEKIEVVFQPAQEFLNKHFQTLRSGVIAIASQGKEWAELVQEKITTQLDSFISQSKWLSGAQEIQKQWIEWFDAYKNKPSEIWTWIKGLDKNKLTEYAQTIHTFVKTIYETLEHISALFKHLKQMLESAKASEVNSHSNLLGSLLQIAQSPDSGNTIQNLGKTILDNSNVSFKLGLDNFAAIVGLAATDATLFNNKIKQLSESTTSGSEGKWGEYKSPEELMAALGLKDALKRKELVDKIVQVTTCPPEKNCGTDYNKIIKDFFESIKTTVEGLKSSKPNLKDAIEKFTNKLTPEEYFKDAQGSTTNITQQLVDALLNSAIANKQKK